MALLVKIRVWLCNLLGCSPADKKDTLLGHFMTQLNDEFLYCQSPSGEPATTNPAISARIQELLAAPEPDWERAYEIQRLLVFLKPSRRLALEAERRVSEAEGLKLPSGAGFRVLLDSTSTGLAAAITAANAAAAAAAAADPASPNRAQLVAVAAQAREQVNAVQADADNQRRAILSATFDDLQWFYQKRNLVRAALSNSAINLVCFGLWTMLVTALPFFAFLYERQTNSAFFNKFIEQFPNYGLYTAMSFGLLGAFFSRLISLQFTRGLTVEDAENLFSVASLTIRAAVGMCGAAIMYFLLNTKILGLIAPDLTKLSYSVEDVQTVLVAAHVLIPSKDWCLLVVWSFLAGFSEQLVPDSLARAEAEASGKKT